MAFIAALCSAGIPVCAADSKLRSFGVDSHPPGAEVYTIRGRIGTTPVFVSERDIYPNNYPEEKIDLYGRIILRRKGCEEYSRRITLDDLRQGVEAQLQCDTPSSQGARAASAERQPAPRPGAKPEAKPRASAPPSSPSSGGGNAARSIAPEQRLRWLKVIEELRSRGLLTDEEERRIRRRVLDAP